MCERHFVSRRAANSWDRYSVHWVSTLCLGHTKIESGPRKLEKELSEARGRGIVNWLKKKTAEEERKKKLEVERTAKKVNLQRTWPSKLHYNEEKEEVLNEKRFQTEEAACTEFGTQLQERDDLFIPLKQDEKPFHRYGFVKNEIKARLYTGLSSFDSLNTLFLQVSPYASRYTLNLTRFRSSTIYFEIGMKLKVDMPLKNFSYRFGVSLSTFSRVFRCG